MLPPRQGEAGLALAVLYGRSLESGYFLMTEVARFRWSPLWLGTLRMVVRATKTRELRTTVAPLQPARQWTGIAISAWLPLPTTMPCWVAIDNLKLSLLLLQCIAQLFEYVQWLSRNAFAVCGPRLSCRVAWDPEPQGTPAMSNLPGTAPFPVRVSLENSAPNHFSLDSRGQ